MKLDQIYFWAFELDDPFTPENKHLSSSLLVAEIAEDLCRKTYSEELLTLSDSLDNLYIKLSELKISLDEFLDLIYLSQKADADKYLFTMYGANCWLFDEFSNLYDKNPKLLKKFGINRIPLDLDPETMSISTDFFTLLNIGALKTQITKSNLSELQKSELLDFFTKMKSKAQFEHDSFDLELSAGFKPKESLKKIYEKLINSSDKTFFKEIVESAIGIINDEQKMLHGETSVSENEKAVEKGTARSVEVAPQGITFENIEKIREHIVGQDNAVRRVVDRLMAGAIGLKDPNKPVCSFLLDGPTGIGKTEMAKAIAKACFGGRIHVEDMSEYKHESDLSRLTGASAGFIGYNDTPALINFLTNNDSGVILFDEIDKCNPKCLDILMRMIDEGEFQTAKGDMLSTKGMVIVCTTNMSEYVSHREVGFNVVAPKDGKHAEELASTGSIRKEILGRFDEIIKFDKLTKEECSEIALRYLISHAAKFNANHKQDRVRLIPTPEFIADIIEESNYKVFGGRNVCSVARKLFDMAIVNYYKEQKIVRDRTIVVLSRDKVEAYSSKQFAQLRASSGKPNLLEEKIK